MAGSLNPFCGIGFGARRGRRNRFFVTGLTGWQRAVGGAQSFAVPSKEQEVDALREQAEYLENSLAHIKQRIQGIETGKSGQ